MRLFVIEEVKAGICDIKDEKQSIDSNDPMNRFNRSFESIHWILTVEIETLHFDLAKGK